MKLTEAELEALSKMPLMEALQMAFRLGYNRDLMKTQYAPTAPQGTRSV